MCRIWKFDTSTSLSTGSTSLFSEKTPHSTKSNETDQSTHILHLFHSDNSRFSVSLFSACFFLRTWDYHYHSGKWQSWILRRLYDIHAARRYLWVVGNNGIVLKKFVPWLREDFPVEPHAEDTYCGNLYDTGFAVEEKDRLATSWGELKGGM